jgi:meiotic recombination protein SPO11
VDGDAYGLDILSVYKFGSRSLRHENDKLAANRLEWLGIWASEIAEYL